ncbi:protein SOB FIVE-LIKE 1 isoform X2 [Rhodamnia argentea]|nr:protein SOB FIVE-LIKE 1 isoform X2 [Rhodamnia argentea]
MESSPQAFEGSEECLSSESGWTMYIGSPMQEDDEGAGDEKGTTHNEDDDDERDGGDKGDKDGGDGEAESDDSMASDASSRPSYRGCVATKNGGSCAAKKGKSKNGHKEEDDDDDDDDDLKQRADGTNPSPSKGKVSKSLRMKKRK